MFLTDIVHGQSLSSAGSGVAALVTGELGAANHPSQLKRQS
jgi:hypothetical protein